MAGLITGERPINEMSKEEIIQEILRLEFMDDCPEDFKAVLELMIKTSNDN